MNSDADLPYELDEEIKIAGVLIENPSWQLLLIIYRAKDGDLKPGKWPPVWFFFGNVFHFMKSDKNQH